MTCTTGATDPLLLPHCPVPPFSQLAIKPDLLLRLRWRCCRMDEPGGCWCPPTPPPPPTRRVAPRPPPSGAANQRAAAAIETANCREICEEWKQWRRRREAGAAFHQSAFLVLFGLTRVSPLAACSTAPPPPTEFGHLLTGLHQNWLLVSQPDMITNIW